MGSKQEPGRTYRLGAVSFLNAKPLIQGLDTEPAIRILFDVPSKLPDMLESGRVDVALVPTIDLTHPDRRWRIISDACIGCDGETFTVRVFSTVPPEKIRRLLVDGDSHTSVALARVIWAGMYDIRLDVQPLQHRDQLRASNGSAEAVLLIGDKVIRPGLFGYEIETDLGTAWKTMTGLPFVFAAWAAPAELETGWLAERLSRARDAGVASAALIAADLGPGLGWPVTLATRYLTQRLKFTLGERQKEGMNRLFDLACKLDILPERVPLEFAR